MKSAPLLEANNVSVRYANGEVALRNLTFQVDQPSFVAVVGPNGSGKSTLLKTALGLLEPFQGEMRVLGFNTMSQSKSIRKRVRYVPQRDRIQLTVPLKVKDIAVMGRLLKKPPPRSASEKDIERTHEALEMVNMDPLWDRPFNELSGGQRQRVLVARALAGEGPVMMLDEPLAGTDAESQDLIVTALGEYHKDTGVNVIMVTHDLNPIHSLVKDVLMMKNSLVGIGTPCDVMDPEVLEKVYGPGAKVLEYSGHRYCVTRDTGVDRHD